MRWQINPPTLLSVRPWTKSSHHQSPCLHVAVKGGPDRTHMRRTLFETAGKRETQSIMSREVGNLCFGAASVAFSCWVQISGSTARCPFPGPKSSKTRGASESTVAQDLQVSLIPPQGHYDGTLLSVNLDDWFSGVILEV